MSAVLVLSVVLALSAESVHSVESAVLVLHTTMTTLPQKLLHSRRWRPQRISLTRLTSLTFDERQYINYDSRHSAFNGGVTGIIVSARSVCRLYFPDVYTRRAV